MVNACGKINGQLEAATFPSADVAGAFARAAGRKHHTVVDAIWGYTQFLLDGPTRKVLTITHKSGLYEWLRMPFGPAPAPALMQSYVHKRFGGLRCVDTGGLFCSPLMDDIVVSSETLERHIKNVNQVNVAAEESGFEFKLTKAQFNQLAVELWGVICDEHGRRTMPKKILQLENWPEPTQASDLVSFLAFVNYLREFMDPEWLKDEQVLACFRKKEAKRDFEKVWKSDPKYFEAFKRIRTRLGKDVVLHHIDFAAAENPDESGRPLELFIDASDYGWCATLCQRQTPHGAPKIISCVAKGFDETQLKWSAMERELYALWKGVLAHDKYLRGFFVYAYTDHKNSLFSNALLENRRIGKKVSKWALELQVYNLTRVWIRGEANVLSDAPSRAPWAEPLARHLPIPVGPVYQLVRQMYNSPEEWAAGVVERHEQMGGGVWAPIPKDGDDANVLPEGGAGARTPEFGDGGGRGPPVLVKSMVAGEEFTSLETYPNEFGSGEVVENPTMGYEYPRWPAWHSTEDDPVRILPVVTEPMAVTVDPHALPYYIEHDTGRGSGDHARAERWRVRWPRSTEFTDGISRQTIGFSSREYGSEAKARDAAWQYFSLAYRRELVSTKAGLGPVGPAQPDGMMYHGTAKHEFVVYPKEKVLNEFKFAVWNRRSETLDGEAFCSNCAMKCREANGAIRWRCNGHAPADCEVGTAESPVASAEGAHDGETSSGGARRKIQGKSPAPPEGSVSGPQGSSGSSVSGPRKKVRGTAEYGATGGDGLSTWSYRVPSGSVARMLTWELMVDDAKHHQGVPRNGPPIELVRRRLTKDSATQLVLEDVRFATVEDQVGFVWTERLDRPRDLEVLYWYLSPDGQPFTPLPSEGASSGSGRAKISKKIADEGERAVVAADDPSRSRAQMISDGLRAGAGIAREAAMAKLPIADLERERLSLAQQVCPDLAATYKVVEARDKGETRFHQILLRLKEKIPDCFAKRKNPEGVIKDSARYEIIGGILYRRVYDVTDDEVQLRACAPRGAMRSMQMPGIGECELELRKELFVIYHSSHLGGHLKRDKTIMALERDWWWPGMYEDVRDWVKACTHCQAEAGVTGQSAWTRTNLYSRPFRALQFDTVAVPAGSITGSPYLLTVTDLFSRWCWLIPVPSEEAKNIAEGLLIHVFGPFNCYPDILRSDNAPPFMSQVIQYVNSKLEIRHITGASHHPQSQGAIERLHRTLGSLVRAFCEAHDGDWEVHLPFIVGRLRAMEMKTLGGRSPYEVVTGLKPVLPATMKVKLPVVGIGVDEYVKGLVESLENMHGEIQRIQRDASEADLARATGKTTDEIQVGDVVMRRKPEKDMPKGRDRFTGRTDGEMYRVVEKCGVNTFRLESLLEAGAMVPGSVDASRLLKVDLPTMNFREGQSRVIEIHNDETDDWERANLERMAADGRVFVRFEAATARPEWIDLAKKRYRWVR